GNFALINPQLALKLIDERIDAHQPAAHVFADVDMMLARRLLMKHRVEGRDAQDVRRRIVHQSADVFGDFLRDPSELALGKRQNWQQRRPLLGVMSQDYLIAPLALFAELNHRSSSPAMMFKLLNVAIASAT